MELNCVIFCSGGEQNVFVTVGEYQSKAADSQDQPCTGSAVSANRWQRPVGHHGIQGSSEVLLALG